MDVRQLRCYVAVAEELHFGRAAARLHVAQPAVSQTVKAIEKELGLVLLDRSQRRVRLTDAGALFLTESRAVLARLDSALTAMARYRDADSGRLGIGVAAALPPTLVPDLVTRIRDRHPELVVSVHPLPVDPDVADLVGSGLDLVLVRTPVRRGRGIGSRVVAREAIGVAVARAHPLAALATITPAQLSGHPLAVFARSADPDVYDAMFGALTAAGYTGAGALHESHGGAVDASLRLVASGAAVSLKLPSEVRAFGNPDVTWRPLSDVDLEVVVTAAWCPDRMRGPRADVLRLLPRPDPRPTPPPTAA
jgi:DNA-binding transcriptional LysR family regulator